MEASLEAALREVPEKLYGKKRDHTKRKNIRQHSTTKMKLEILNFRQQKYSTLYPIPKHHRAPQIDLRGSGESGGRANGSKDGNSREFHGRSY
jgi:hypothetical protein